jgi:hypothetical protein
VFKRTIGLGFRPKGRTAVALAGYLWTVSSREQCVGRSVVPLRAGVEALDEFYWDAPGPRFAFGEVHEGAVRPFFVDILHYGNDDLLVATARFTLL